MEREACVCDHGFERSDLCAEIIIIIIGKIERRLWIIILCTALSVFFIRSLDLSNNKWYVWHATSKLLRARAFSC